MFHPAASLLPSPLRAFRLFLRAPPLATHACSRLGAAVRLHAPFEPFYDAMMEGMVVATWTWGLEAVGRFSVAVFGRRERMKRLLLMAMIIGVILGGTQFLLAQEQQAPPPASGAPVPGQRPLSPPMLPPALMGLMGAMPKQAPMSSSPEQPLYPMFQILGPSLTGAGSLSPEALGTLLTMQGEMMVKMGEVLMKYGEMLSGKSH